MRVAGFDWDDGNRQKCAKHGLSVDQIEALFRRPVLVLPDDAHSQAERRYRAIAKDAAGRHVFVVFTLRGREGRRLIRPISARYMHKREIEAYEAQNPDVCD